jgi:predicted ATP-grasp superfamily ATP-dependent carboligase
MAEPRTVLVTGADQHQGLAVIRGLGLGGARVVACGAERRSIGFYSRYAVARYRYTSPLEDGERFVSDVITAVEETRPDLVIPAVESTLVALDNCRTRIERHVPLAAPPSSILAKAIDKKRTLDIAARAGIPTPRTLTGDSLESIVAAANTLRFPVAVKPRGNRLHAASRHNLDFKVLYASSAEGLAGVLGKFGDDVRRVLVQDFIRGVGLCVAAVVDHGALVAHLAYVRDRECPLTGGVSVLRTSVEPDARLLWYVESLLGEMQWHGIAMVEFKYDAEGDRYVLMEVNGRFQASTALSLDAGLNLPHMVARLYTGQALCVPAPRYQVGVRERWLRGDILTLRDLVLRKLRRGQAGVGPLALPPLWGIIWQFLRDFRPGTRYDEFKWYDLKPGLVEACHIAAMLVTSLGSLAWGLAKRLRRAVFRRVRGA